MNWIAEKMINALGGKVIEPSRPTMEAGKPQITARRGIGSPFDAYFDQYQPMRIVFELFDAMREAIPLIDVAIRKRARLVSGVILDGQGDTRVQKVLDSIMHVRVGGLQSGLDTLIEQICDPAFHKGYSVWEMVPDVAFKKIHRTMVGRPDNFIIDVNAGGETIIKQRTDGGAFVDMPRQDLLFAQVFGTTDGGNTGKPLFWACPFLAKIIVRILVAVDAVIWRFGDPTILSVLKGGTMDDIDALDAAVTAYGQKLTQAMAARKAGSIYDVQIGVPESGEFSVKMLGADSKPIDISVDYRLALEQIISASELAAWHFGLSWSTTERLAKEQNEATISVVEGNRLAIEPGIRGLVDTALILAGLGGRPWTLDWEPLNLSDELGVSRSRLYTAQAKQKELESAISLYDVGILDDQQLLNHVTSMEIIPGSSLSGPTETKIATIKKRAETRRAIATANMAMKGFE